MNEEIPNFTGALPDTRPEEVKATDPKFEEIVGTAAAVSWVEKPESQWRTFPVLNQKQSGMCGAFSFRKLMGVYFWLKYKSWVDFSEEDIYQRRVNKPSGGMALDDIYKIASEGVTLKQLTGTTIFTDMDADQTKIEDFKHDVGKIFKMGRKITLPNDIDTIASTIQKTGKAIHFFTYFTSAEWSQFIPKIITANLNFLSAATLRHYVTIVDFTLYQGKKYLIVEDSAHFGGLSRRLISEDWIAKRSVMVTYPMSFLFDKSDSEIKPSYDESVTSLQNCLKAEGLFPINVESTGVFGPVTTKAVKDFQKKYGLEQIGTIGPRTKAKLRELYP